MVSRKWDARRFWRRTGPSPVIDFSLWNSPGESTIRKALVLLSFLYLTGPLGAATINFTIDAGATGSPIPSQAYGTDQSLPGINLPLYRQGGNRMTAYNWENNASNAGSDYGPNHEDWFDVPGGVTPPGMPATTITKF